MGLDIRSTFPIPICAICNCPVHTMEIEGDPAGDGFFITVICHGERETMTLPRLEVIAGALRCGRAFHSPKELQEAAQC